MKTGLSVVVPCYNEEANVPTLVKRLKSVSEKLGTPCEVVLVDDGSSDNTWEVIQNISEEYGVFVVPRQNPQNLGMVAAWKLGISESNFNSIALMDADLQNPPEALEALWLAFKTENCHIMQGTRSSIEWDPGARLTASRGLNFLLNLIFKDDAKDNKSGFVIAPKSILEECLDFKKSYKYGQSFIRVSARSRGYEVGEIETLFLPRHAGESFLSSSPALKVYLGVLSDIFKAVGEFGRGQKHPLELAISEQQKNLKPYVGYRGLRKFRLNLYFATMPLHAWIIRPRVKYLYEYLSRTQWLSSAELKQLQLARLQRLLWHAYVHVPYYRKMFVEANLTPRDIRGLGDLEKLKMLSKQDVSENLYFDLFSEKHDKRKMHKIATSGSTGHPFVTYADQTQLEIRFASTIRSAEWTGWRVGDKQARLWHQTLGMNRVQVFKEHFDAFLLRRTFIPAFELTAEGLDQLAIKLNKIKPVLIDGYAESLNFLATYLTQGGKLEFSPKGVMSSAQMLTEQTRTQIESGLQSKVFDKYGAREFSGIAYQCDSSEDHHVLDESYIVEVIKEGRPAEPGELGEVVITDLNNFSVPLIRYRIGDLAVAADNTVPCECGRGLSRIGKIEGRTQALIHCANGRWIPGTFFAHFFKEYDYLVQFFQIVQLQQGEFTIKCVKGSQWSASGWQALVDNLREYVGETLIQTEYVDEIPLLKTGKRTPVVSEVKLDFQKLS